MNNLAYYDSFSGLVPCKIISILPDNRLKIELTATRQAYKRGERLYITQSWVIPRECVKIRSGQYRILSNYGWSINERGQVVYTRIYHHAS